MRYFPLLALTALVMIGCKAELPTATQPATPSTEPPPETTLPDIGILTFDELDIAGCGMTLLAPGTDARTDGIYLFNGMSTAVNAPTGSMRMKLDGEVVNFVRTATGGEALIGDQFTTQTFVSQDGAFTVVVEITQTTAQADPEVIAIDAATLRLNHDGQAITLAAQGDTGC